MPMMLHRMSHLSRPWERNFHPIQSTDPPRHPVTFGLPLGGFLLKSIDHIQLYLKSDNTNTLGNDLPTFVIISPRLRDGYENKKHWSRHKYKRAPINMISVLVIESKIQSPSQYLACTALNFMVIMSHGSTSMPLLWCDVVIRRHSPRIITSILYGVASFLYKISWRKFKEYTGCPNKSARFNFLIKRITYSKSFDIFISV